MGHASETRFLVLHGLRLKGFGEAPAVAAAVGLDDATVDDHLAKLQAEELVLRRDGRLSGWTLTPSGRGEQQRLAGDELDATATRATVHDGYQRFLALNAHLLGICTAWQLQGEALYDHSDLAYDAEVVARLTAHDEGLRPILADLTAALDRYAGYQPRFDDALRRLAGGDRDYFTKPIIDSYHTVWFELHEDLLSSLGLERSQEEGH